MPDSLDVFRLQTRFGHCKFRSVLTLRCGPLKRTLCPFQERVCSTKFVCVFVLFVVVIGNWTSLDLSATIRATQSGKGNRSKKKHFVTTLETLYVARSCCRFGCWSFSCWTPALFWAVLCCLVLFCSVLSCPVLFCLSCAALISSLLCCPPAVW